MIRVAWELAKLAIVFFALLPKEVFREACLRTGEAKILRFVGIFLVVVLGDAVPVPYR